MKNYLYIVIILFSFGMGSAQVGINNSNPDDSAILDISSVNKGVLLPRMDLKNLTEALPVSNPSAGLLVWNTDADNGGAVKGVYYWNNEWIRLGNENASTTAPVDTASFGQLTLNNDLNTNLQQYTFTSVDAPSSGFASADIRVNDGNLFSLRPTQDAIYQVTFTVTYRKNSNNGADDIEFYLFKNNNAIADAKVNGSLSRNLNTLTFSKLVKLEANQYYGIGISKSDSSPRDLPLTILKNQTNLSIHKI